MVNFFDNWLSFLNGEEIRLGALIYLLKLGHTAFRPCESVSD